jgi:hypothetical protein
MDEVIHVEMMPHSFIIILYACNYPPVLPRGNVLVPVFGLKTRQKTRQKALIGFSIVNRYRYSSIGNPHTSRFAIVSRF